MSLSDAENITYQNSLKYITELSLNLMAVKATVHPENFLGWCSELLRICRHELNMELLEKTQLPSLKKLQDILEAAVSIGQLKMTRIAPWPIYLNFVEQQQDIHALDERLRLLGYVEEIKAKPLADMLIEDRLAFSGKHTNQHDISVYNFDVQWFSSTKGAKLFHQLLTDKTTDFDAALAHIPQEGEVTFSHYEQFAQAYSAIFSSYTDDKAQGEKAPLAPATRLLAMRRPDQFIALTKAKIDLYCQGLSIAKFNAFDFKSYWFDLIGTIRTCAWWHQPQPEVNSENDRELVLWKNRAILLDCFFHADEDLANHSNFIKLRDKPKSSHSVKASASVARKRTKESAEMLVDKALAADDMPEYLLGMRGSIIKQVTEGKSVEHAISIMRGIFG